MATPVAKSIQPVLETISQQEQQNRIVVKDNNQIKIIPTADILFIEAYDDYVKIHTTSGLFVKKQTLSFYEQSLDKKQFVRVHRSYLLAISQLTKIEPMEKNSYVGMLKNGGRIPLSRSGYSLLKETLGW